MVHIPRWDEPLQPKDGRNPPAQAVPPSWDPHPIVMMNATQAAAEEERRRKEAASQPPPEAKARPTSPGGGASASTGSAGASAKPPPKARPTPPPTPPDCVIARVPHGYLFKTSTNPDHRGSLFMTSAWMNSLDQFLLSIMQGPAASASNITGWAQYLRRVSAYGCMIFGICNPGVVTDDDAAKISEADWLKCYSHLVRTQVLAKTGCYLSTASLLMMLGRHDNEVANVSGLGRIKKSISNPLACRIIDPPHGGKDSDVLAGEFRRGTTILITDLMYRVGTSTGCHDMGMGLNDMGWSVELFKIHESEAERPIDQFLETMDNVTEFIKSQVADEGNVTVHIWLSLQLLHSKRPPHYVMLENTFMAQFVKAVIDLDQLVSRPVILAINNDSMFNCVDSITSRTAVEMTERLKAQGVMVTTDQRMWRSMYSQFGRQSPILNTTRKGSLGKTAIWSVIEKNLFRQRVFLMCATNREHVSALNEGAYKPDQSGIDPELLREVTGPTQVFRIASGEMAPEDYAAADAAVFQKGPPDGAPTARFNKDKRYKAQWVEPMVQIQELEPSPVTTCYWFPVFTDSVDFLCASCRGAQTMDEIEMNQSRPSTCINCSANTQDHYKKSAPTLGARKSVLMLAARLKVAFANCGLDYMDINEGFQKWLVFAAASVVANANLRYGGELMKSLSHMGGVRVPPHQGQGNLQERPWKAVQRLS